MLCSSTEYLRFFAITYLSRLSLTLITLLHSIAQDELYFVTTGDLSPGTEMVNIKYINIMKSTIRQDYRLFYYSRNIIICILDILLPRRPHDRVLDQLDRGLEQSGDDQCWSEDQS